MNDYYCRNCKSRFVPITWVESGSEDPDGDELLAVCVICGSNATEEIKNEAAHIDKNVIPTIIKERKDKFPDERLLDEFFDRCEDRRSKMCFCIGPDKCGDSCCPQVQQYRKNKRRIDIKSKKIWNGIS
jgi:hypothetical protein